MNWRGGPMNWRGGTVNAASEDQRTAPPPTDGGETAPVLQISDVAKRFGGIAALDGVSLEVERGSLAALIGPNGAGKSTLFNAITGLVTPDRGSVRVDGIEVSGLSLGEIAELGVGRAFQTPRGFHSMTLIENLCVVPRTRGESLHGAYLPWKADRQRAMTKAKDVLARFGLDGLADKPYEGLSGGDMRLAEIARLLMRDVRLLLLDEPTAGVHPDGQERLAAILNSLREDGMTTLVVEHNLPFILSLASTVTVLTNGQVLSCGTPGEVQADPAVIKAYLGESTS